MKDLILGVDLGTTRVKAGAFDSQGNLIEMASKECTLLSEHPTWAEQNPDAWWESFAGISKKVAGRVEKKISCMCIVGQGPTVVSIDSDGNPLRPAIVWMDRRATRESEIISDKLGQYVDSTYYSIPKIMWLKNNEPDIYERTKWFIQSFDYLNYKLTGNVAIASLPSDLQKPWTGQQIGLAKLDIEKFPEFKFTGEEIGKITEPASRKTGLPRGIPVIAGALDFVGSLIGTGTTRKGRACDRGGTSQGLNLCWNEPIEDPQGRIACRSHPVKDLWNISGIMSTTGKSLDWFKDNFYGYQTPYDKMISEASTVPPGSDSLIFLPYLMGERSPIWDPCARGVFFGISLQHTKAHFVRAVLESVAYAMRHVMEVISEIGGEVSEVRTTGGQAKSDLWNHIKADVLDKRILIPSVLDSEILGAAIIAGCGTKKFGDLEEAAEKMVKIKKIIEPNQDNYLRYSRLFELYEKLYPDLKKDFVKLSEVK